MRESAAAATAATAASAAYRSTYSISWPGTRIFATASERASDFSSIETVPCAMRVRKPDGNTSSDSLGRSEDTSSECLQADAFIDFHRRSMTTLRSGIAIRRAVSPSSSASSSSSFRDEYTPKYSFACALARSLACLQSLLVPCRTRTLLSRILGKR